MGKKYKLLCEKDYKVFEEITEDKASNYSDDFILGWFLGYLAAQDEVKEILDKFLEKKNLRREID